MSVCVEYFCFKLEVLIQNFFFIDDVEIINNHVYF